MFKKLLIVLLCAMPLSAFAQYKFGNFNSQEIMSVMPERAAAEKTFSDFTKKYEDEFLKLREEFDKKYKDFMATQDSLPENIKTRRMQEVDELQNRIRNFQQIAQQDLEKKQQELYAPIQQKLLDAIKAVGEEQKFTYIFDLAVPSIVYSGAPSEDITPLLKAKLGIK